MIAMKNTETSLDFPLETNLEENRNCKITKILSFRTEKKIIFQDYRNYNSKTHSIVVCVPIPMSQ